MTIITNPVFSYNGKCLLDKEKCGEDECRKKNQHCYKNTYGTNNEIRQQITAVFLGTRYRDEEKNGSGKKEGLVDWIKRGGPLEVPMSRVFSKSLEEDSPSKKINIIRDNLNQYNLLAA